MDQFDNFYFMVIFDQKHLKCLNLHIDPRGYPSQKNENFSKKKFKINNDV